MSYNNAIPKALKFLVSDGNLIDEDGNVIAHSDSLKDMYDKAVPQVKKYLLSDGSVVDENGNEIIKNDYFKKVYDQAVPTPQKYLHSDGTISDNLTNNDKAYGWVDSNDNVVYFNFKSSPESDEEFESSKVLSVNYNTELNSISVISSAFISGYESYTKNSDTEFELLINGSTETYSRDSSKDFELWNV